MKQINCLFFLTYLLLLGDLSLAASIDEGLVIDLTFDQEDLDGSLRSGQVLYHGPRFALDRVGEKNRSLLFDGLDDWVELPKLGCLLNYDRNWSINFWGYMNRASGRHVFMAGADGDEGAKQVVIGADFVKLTPRADTEGDWRVGYPLQPYGSWHMYTVTWEKAGRLKVYVDGKLQGEDGNGELADFCPQNTPVIGAVNFSQKTKFFAGKIDDFRLYDRVLEVDEILQVYALVK